MHLLKTGNCGSFGKLKCRFYHKPSTNFGFSSVQKRPVVQRYFIF
ncbi:hypothetical protein NIASO_16530 [Niabella soli DSM 19437]|uniref:Uncharacterized protein n=1 Tax=Niabella soli DSM 19437 TaxID=929713 RepID=W0F956_9BACT|nr:hypothetical protein NIASO_16530 [Niabella soli DSM 19437]